MIAWLNNNLIEIIGAVLAFIYLILEIKRQWFFWVVGIVSSSFYVYIFFHTKLYAEMGLNFYYVLMSAYGLYCWKFSSKESDENLGFHRLNSKTAYVLALLSVFFFIVLFIILRLFSDSPVPVSDSLIAVLSIIATWMAAKKIVECWYIWIFVNIFATGLYIHQNLYPTAVLFIVYSILSFVGLKEWRKSIRNNDTADTKF